MLAMSRSAATAARGCFKLDISESVDWSIAGGEAGGGDAVWIGCLSSHSILCLHQN